MGHISQAWTNLAPPSANFLADCATESLRVCGDGGHPLFLCCNRLPATDAERSDRLIAS